MYFNASVHSNALGPLTVSSRSAVRENILCISMHLFVVTLTVRSRSAHNQGKYVIEMQLFIATLSVRSRSAHNQLTVRENIICISMHLFMATLTVTSRSAQCQGKYSLYFNASVHGNALGPLTVTISSRSRKILCY